MKIFLDSADVAAIRVWNERGLVDGVTTNPTLLSQIGGDPTAVVRAIVALVPTGAISVEVTEESVDDVYQQAHRIAQLGSNVVVKIPCVLDYFPIIIRLVKEKIPLNITLVFSLGQALAMAKLGVRYVSPFVGRLEEIGEPGNELIGQIRTTFDYYGYTTALLAASLRSNEQVCAALQSGADVITLAPSLLEKVVQHELTAKGVQKFAADWQRLQVTRFPT